MRFTTHASLIALVTAGIAGTDVAAQENERTEAQSERFGEIVALDGWAFEDVMAQGWSVENLLDEDVYGPTGEDIGEVEDLIFDGEGRLLAVIAEVGGFWDIGDTHVSIPWDEVEYAGLGEGVVLPVTEETVESYDVFANEEFLPAEGLGEEIVAGVDDAMPGGRAWRVSELIGDYVRLMSGEEWVNYGYVSDVLVQDGEVAATLVSASGTFGRGMYGYPSYAATEYGWDPADPYYDMPYSVEDIDGLQPVDGY